MAQVNREGLGPSGRRSAAQANAWHTRLLNKRCPVSFFGRTALLRLAVDNVLYQALPSTA